jgi:hypothetical protein
MWKRLLFDVAICYSLLAMCYFWEAKIGEMAELVESTRLEIVHPEKSGSGVRISLSPLVFIIGDYENGLWRMAYSYWQRPT